MRPKLGIALRMSERESLCGCAGVCGCVGVCGMCLWLVFRRESEIMGERERERGSERMVEMVLIIQAPAMRTEKKNPFVIFCSNAKK